MEGLTNIALNYLSGQPAEKKESDPPARPARPSAKPGQKTPFSVPRKNSGPSADSSDNLPASGPPILTRPAVFRPQSSFDSNKEGITCSSTYTETSDYLLTQGLVLIWPICFQT